MHPSESTLFALPGVNVAGYLSAELGVGEVARGYIAALRALDCPLAFMDFALGTASPKHLDVPESDQMVDGALPINLICVNADQLPNFIAYASPDFLTKHRNIGAWSWELTEFPKNWDDRFAPFDEIWVSSTFMQDAIGRRSPIPVVKIPTVVAPEVPTPRQWRHFGLADGPFTFLFVFDYLSVFERKNPLALVEAFRSAFPDNEPVRLILKSLNGDQAIQQSRLIAQAVAADPRIVLIDAAMSKDDKDSLIATCDCYISLHRAEGFGLTLAEAMYLGKPVIATGWSGNMDFMTSGNSYPVSFQLKVLDRNHGPYRQGQLWAQPDVQHAARLMRHVFAHPEDARLRGEQAAADIRREFGLTAIATRIHDRLAVLQAGERHAPAPAWTTPGLFHRARFLGMSALRLTYRAGRGFAGRWLAGRRPTPPPP